MKSPYYDLSYAEYLKATGDKDSRQAWIDWKTYACGMKRTEAIKAGYDPEWGWTPGMLDKAVTA